MNEGPLHRQFLTEEHQRSSMFFTKTNFPFLFNLFIIKGKRTRCSTYGVDVVVRIKPERSVSPSRETKTKFNTIPIERITLKFVNIRIMDL